MQILIAEDEELIRRLIGVILMQEPGIVLLEASTGREACALASEHRPDLILLDVRMPQMGGLEACRRMRSDPRTARTPIVLMSALGHEADREAGRQAGADQYLVKPFGPTVLLGLIREFASDHEPHGA